MKINCLSWLSGPHSNGKPNIPNFIFLHPTSIYIIITSCPLAYASGFNHDGHEDEEDDDWLDHHHHHHPGRLSMRVGLFWVADLERELKMKMKESETWNGVVPLLNE